jgi:hypothetical protein
METDDVNNVINQFSKKNTTPNFMDYLSNMFMNDTNNNDIYDDNNGNENYEQAYENVKKLSKMNLDEIQTYHNINMKNFDEYKDTNMYKKKYLNVIDKSFEYKTDYELKLNDDEDIKFIKTKK